MNAKRTIGIVARIFIGLVFVASAVTKLLSIEAVDMFVFEHKLFSWDVTQFLTRFLIAFEGFLGLVLVCGFWQKVVLPVVIAFLAALTLYVLVKPLLFDVSQENCHCFGTVLVLDDTQTIIKNLVLLALSAFMFWQEGVKLRFDKWIIAGLFVVSASLTYVVKAPDIIVYSLYDKSASLDMPKFELLLKDEKVEPLNLQSGKKVLCLYSTGCKHCKRTAMKLDVMIKRHDLNRADFVAVFWGKEESIKKFYKETGAEPLHSAIVPVGEFLAATKGKQPLVVLLEDGKVVDLYRSITIDEGRIVEFLR